MQFIGKIISIDIIVTMLIEIAILDMNKFAAQVC